MNKHWKRFGGHKMLSDKGWIKYDYISRYGSSKRIRNKAEKMTDIAFNETVKIIESRKRRFEMLLTHLKTLYPEINFNIIVKRYVIDLIYDDKSKYDNDTFFEDVFVMCRKFLFREDLLHLAIVYDLLGRMNIKEKIRYE